MNHESFKCVALAIFLVFIMMFMVWDATKRANAAPNGYRYVKTENVVSGDNYRIIIYFTKEETK